MGMKKFFSFSVFIFIVLFVCSNVFIMLIGANTNNKIYILSTSAPEDEYVLPKYKWGECISNFVDTTKLDIINIDANICFINSKEYKEFISKLKRNNYVLLQFVDIYDEFSEDDFNTIQKLNSVYSNCVKDIKKVGAVPIIITPEYINKSESEVKNEYYENIRNSILKWANEKNVKVVDLTEITSNVFDGIVNNFGKQYLDSIYTKSKSNRYAFNYCGAVYVAEFVTESLSQMEGIKEYVKEVTTDVLPHISRGEFIKQLLEVTGESTLVPMNEVFNDVKKDSKYAVYIETAKVNGIVYGSTDGNFYPDRNIQIDEACVIADRLLQTKGILLNKSLTNEYMLKIYGVDKYAIDSVSRFYSVAEKGINYDAYYLMSIYGIYNMVYDYLVE